MSSRQPKAKSVLRTARWRAMPVKVYSAREQQEAIEALAENVMRLVAIVQGLEAVPPVDLVEGKNISIQRGDVQGKTKFKVSAVIPEAAAADIEAAGRVAINTGATAIPPYSAMEMLSVNADGSVNVGRPTEDDLPAGRVLFSLAAINSGETGRGYSAFDFPVEVECDDSPAVGDELGTQVDDFPLAEGSGFIYQGDTESGRGTVRPTGGGVAGNAVRVAEVVERTDTKTYVVHVYLGWGSDYSLPEYYLLESSATMLTPNLDDTEEADQLPVGAVLLVVKKPFLTIPEPGGGPEEISYWVPIEPKPMTCPGSGSHVLMCVDGTLKWVEVAAFACP